MLDKGRCYNFCGLLLGVGASLALIFACFSETTTAQFFTVLAMADRQLIWAFLVLHLLGGLFRWQRYHLILTKVGQAGQVPNRWFLLLVTFARNACADFLPMRLGEGVYFYMVNRLGVNLVSCTSSFGLSLALDLVVLGLMFFGVMIVSLLSMGMWGTLTVKLSYLVVGAVITVATLFMCYYADLIAAPILNRSLARLKVTGKKGRISLVIRRALQWGQGLIDDLRLIRESGCYGRLLSLTLGLRICKYLGLYLLVLALTKQFGLSAANLPFVSLFLAFVIAEASTSLPVSGIMGFGVAQGVWVGVLATLGVSLPNKLTIALGVQIITQLTAYSLGAISLFVFFLLMLQKRAVR